MLAAVKHFPGVGSATPSTEEGPAQRRALARRAARRDLVPFRAAFRAGAPAVVLSHALLRARRLRHTRRRCRRRSRPTCCATSSGFRGIAITDDLADPAITAYSSVPEAAVQAIRAGADMVHISGPASDQQAAYVALLRAARRGTISRERLDQAVGRILTTKRALRLIGSGLGRPAVGPARGRRDVGLPTAGF